MRSIKVVPFDLADGTSSKTTPVENQKLIKNKKTVLIFLGIFIGFLGIATTILLIIGGFAPCVFKKCHANATCINKPFMAKCRCNYGFVGNGVDDCDECGLAYPTEQTHLNEQLYYDDDGELALPFAFPDAVFIKFVYQSVFQFNGTTYYGSEYDWCFGSVINRRFILTTAHCVPNKFDFKPYNEDRLIEVPVEFNPLYPSWTTIVHVYIKLYDYIAQNYEITPSEMVVVEDIIYYSGFDYHTIDHDIALIKLKNPLKFDNQLQPVCIPTEYDLPMRDHYLAYNQSGITLGWNWYWNGTQYAMLLTDYWVNVFHPSNCSDLFPGLKDTDEIICAGEYVYLHKPDIFAWYCQGYPGTSLYMNKTVNGVKRRFAAGLSANDSVCGYAAYTNLFYYSSWIHQYADY